MDKTNLVSYEDYIIYKERYNELKFILKDTINDEKELFKLKESYTDDINIKINYCVIKTKPCEFSLIENEKKLLLSYLNKLTQNEINDMKINGIHYNDEDIINTEHLLSLLKDEYLEIQNKEKDLILTKPSYSNNHLIDKEDLLKQISNIFINIDELKEHYSNIKQINTFDTNEINTINYNQYKNLLLEKTNLETNLELTRTKIISLENDFQITFKNSLNKI